MSHTLEYLAAVGRRRMIRLWADRLRRLIRDAPDGVIALVHHHTIEICDKKELRNYEAEHGHRDGPPSITSITGSEVFEPNSESV